MSDLKAVIYADSSFAETCTVGSYNHQNLRFLLLGGAHVPHDSWAREYVIRRRPTCTTAQACSL